LLSSCGQTAAQRTDNPKGLPFVRRLLQSQKNFGYTEYILIDCCGKPNSKLCHRFQQSSITKAKAPFYALVILVHPEDKLTTPRSNLEILIESMPLIGIKLNKNQVINASGIKKRKKEK
jgi:hypothetical protein